jgi:hypothetical protein
VPRHNEISLPIGSIKLAETDLNHLIILLKQYYKKLKHTETLSQISELCQKLGVEPKENSILGWDALRSLSKNGVVLGAHTQTHPLIDRITLEEARDEVTGSLDDLRREIGSTLPIFAYPGGQFSQDVVDMLRRENIILAFTTMRGINDLKRMDPLQIQRTNVGAGTSMPVLRAQLLSWTVYVNRLSPLFRM